MENTIFYGNGLNYFPKENITWKSLLDRINGKETTVIKDFFTATYEQIFLNNSKTEQDIKKEIAKLLKEIESNAIYESLYNSNCQNFITTNYDRAFESVLELKGVKISKKSTEKIYSIRRVKELTKENEKKFLWQIHGEVDVPKTIMLGLDHYCGSIGKIDDYIKGTGSYNSELSIEEKFNKIKFLKNSWIELFFTTNVHIIGFGLDYSETDIWWILNKRARLRKENLKDKIKNKIYFYCAESEKEEDIQKQKLLESFDVTVEQIDTKRNPHLRESDYLRIIQKYLNHSL